MALASIVLALAGPLESSAFGPITVRTLAGLWPLVAGVASYSCLVHRHSRTLAFGLTLVLLYAWSAFSVELLSAMGELNPAGSAGAWGLFALGALLARRPYIPAVKPLWRLTALESLPAWLYVGFVLLATGITAFWAAPNNWDSMVYHLPRVMHWVQEGSVAFYPTGISRQVSQPPAAEYAILHTVLLSGGDRWANSIQWLALAAALAAVWELTRLLVPERTFQNRSRGWALVLAASVPMAILQASSTQNDLVLGALLLWCAVFGWRTIRYRSWLDAAMSALAAGLALWTKGTAWVFLPPLLLVLGLGVWRVQGWRFAGGALLMLVLAMLVCNVPHAVRNHQAFGSYLGPDYSLANAHPGLGVGLGNTARNGAWLLRSPWEQPNAWLHDATGAWHGLLGRDLHDPEATWPWSPAFDPAAAENRVSDSICHEDYAPAPLIMGLFLLASLGLLLGSFFNSHSNAGRQGRSLSLLAWWLAFLLFGAVLRWQVWHPRLLLPLLLFTAPLTAAWLARRAVALQGLVLVLLLLGSVPLWWGNHSRPWTGEESIFHTPRNTQYFATRPALETAYGELVAPIESSAPVALHLRGDSWEYPLWFLAPGRTWRTPAMDEKPSGWVLDWSDDPILNGSAEACRELIASPEAGAPSLLFCEPDDAADSRPNPAP